MILHAVYAMQYTVHQASQNAMFSSSRQDSASPPPSFCTGHAVAFAIVPWWEYVYCRHIAV